MASLVTDCRWFASTAFQYTLLPEGCVSAHKYLICTRLGGYYEIPPA